MQESDGAYYTNYKITLFYHENNSFEELCARLFERVQAIPLLEEPDMKALSEVPEFITPLVVLFGLTLPQSIVDKFTARGFQKIYCIVDGECSEGAANYCTLAPRDAYDYEFFSCNLTDYYFYEHLLCERDASYESNLKVTHHSGRYLMCAVKFLGVSEAVSRVNRGYQGTDNIDKLVEFGKAICEVNASRAISTLKRGVSFFTKDADCLLIEKIGKKELLQSAPVHPASINKEYVISYRHLPNDLLKVRVYSTKHNTLLFLQGFEPVGSFSYATARVPIAEVHQFLPGFRGVVPKSIDGAEESDLTLPLEETSDNTSEDQPLADTDMPPLDNVPNTTSDAQEPDLDTTSSPASEVESGLAC